jgi:hypothetical protein
VLRLRVPSERQFHRSDQLQGSRLGIDDEAVRLGMDKARAKGEAIGRSLVVERVEAHLVVQLRNEGKSWREIAEAHPMVKSSSGKRIRPSVGSIRRAYAAETAGSLAQASSKIFQP